MPAAAPIILSAAISGAIAASWTVFGAALLLGAISYALTPKVKAPSFGRQNNTITVRQSDLTRQIVYGHTRITRGYAQIESTGVNKELHIILMLCQGQLRAITEVWLDEYCIPADWIDTDGNVNTGRYKDKLTIRKHLGEPFQTADTEAVANIPGWTADHRLQGIAYLYLILEKDQDVYPNGVPNITAIVEGATVYDYRTAAQTWSTNMALYAHDFITNGAYGFGAFSDDVDPVNISAQANICDEIVAVDETPVSVSAIDISTNIITLAGDLLAYEYGDQVQIASSGTIPAGLAALTNYYVIPYQVKDKPRILLATSLDNAMAKTAIDITSAGTGTITIEKVGEPRYHGSGVVDMIDELNKTLNDLCSCMAGRAINVAGFWTLLAGAWRTPAVEFTIGDVRGGGIRIQNAISMSDSYNGVKGIFYSQQNFYQSSDYPVIQFPTFVAQDNGIESLKEINLPFIGRPTTATRIGKIETYRGRQQIAVNVDFSMKALRVQTGEVVSLTWDRYGWEEKPFEVTEMTFVNDNGALTCRMVLRETAQAVYDWSAGEAIDFDPAPNSTLPNYFDVQVPGGVAYNSRQISTVGGDTVYTMTLQWDLHPDAFVRSYGDFEVQFKLSADSVWQPSFFVDGALTSTDVVNSSVNVYYDLRIRARNNLGVRSNWVTILNAVVGSSGGIGATFDWGNVFDAPGFFNDWGNVYDAPTGFNDWGSA